MLSFKLNFPAALVCAVNLNPPSLPLPRVVDLSDNLVVSINATVTVSPDVSKGEVILRIKESAETFLYQSKTVSRPVEYSSVKISGVPDSITYLNESTGC